MAITLDYENSIINVNKVDMVLKQSTPSVIYTLDLDVFRLTLKDLEDDSDSMAFLRTHSHNTTVSVGGAVLARVIQIINGWTVTFEDDQYRVETVGANSNIGEVINVNQVSVSTSNSAGLQDLNSLQAASYNGEVTVNTSSGFAGTTFPTGTRQRPCSNMADAHAIADERGIGTFHVMSDLTLTSEDFSDGHTFLGEGASHITVTINSGANVSNCTFRSLTVQGTLDNGNILRECSLLDITNINGFISRCALGGIITLGGNAQATVTSCYSGIAGGATTPTINFGGSGNALALRDYSGGLKITNKTDTDAVSLDFVSGQLVVDSTVTAGDLTIRGICKVTDSSTGTANVIDETVSASLSTIDTTTQKGLTRNQFMGLK